MTTTTTAAPVPSSSAAPGPGGPPPTSKRRRRSRGSTARLVVLALFALGFLIPLYVMVSASLKSSANAGIEHMWELPIPLDASGLVTAWERLQPNLVNSISVVIPATIVSSLVGSLNGYLLAKIRFRFSNIAFVFVLMGMYIPFQAVLVPLVQFLQSIGLYGTIGGLTLVHIVFGLPITTLIFRNYYAGIPNELVEASAIDGAGVIGTYLRVFLPLSAPGFVVCAIFQFTNIWNDFLFGLVVIPDGTRQPVTVALNNLAGTTSVDWNTVMAGALIAAIPTAIVYLILGRFFVRGLLAGSYR